VKINLTANLHALWTCHSLIARVNVKASPDLYYDSEDPKQMLMDAFCYVISMKPLSWRQNVVCWENLRQKKQPQGRWFHILCKYIWSSWWVYVCIEV